MWWPRTWRRHRPAPTAPALDHVEKVGTMVEQMSSGMESEVAWAARVARELLEPLEERWRHTLRVVSALTHSATCCLQTSSRC
jgi:hypothetical protein